MLADAVSSNKRKEPESLTAVISKRAKADESKSKSELQKPSSARHFAPPQLKRPNVSTEDIE